jgi:RHS repeat-associated protein
VASLYEPGNTRPALPSSVATTSELSLGYGSGGELSSVALVTNNAYEYTESHTFDTQDRVESLTRVIGDKTYATSYEYNQASQPTRLTYPSGKQVNLAYDDHGRLNSLTDQYLAPYANAMSYNIEARPTGLTLGNGVVRTNTFDPNRSQLATQTASKNGVSLMNLSYNYDAGVGQSGATTTAGNTHQLISLTGTINGTTESASYTYDLAHRLITSAQSSNGASAQRRFAYDRWGNRTAEWDAVSGGSQIQSITLQQSGGAPTNRITSVTNSGVTANYTYDAAGNVTNDGAHGYTYDAGNRPCNGVAETFTYDANRLQVTSQVATKSGAPTGGLMNVTYDYQAAAGKMGAGSTSGNPGQLMSTSGTINSTTESAAYSYDNLGRLVTSDQTTNSASAQRQFSYDRWGNRSAVYDGLPGGKTPPALIQSIQLEQSGGAPTNRITGVTNNGTPSSYAYDAVGNVTNDGTHTYQYDADNRVVSVDSGATAQYKYDHQNRRVSKIIGSSWTHYVWQGAQVIGEHDATTAYTTNPTYQVNSARLDYIYAGSHRIYSRERSSSGGSWTTKYYLSDRLSTRVVLDTGGNVLGRMAHLPFGEDFGQSGTQEKHHLASYERDVESGKDYAVNRQYAQSVGRFSQADPYKASGYMVNPQSWNRYSYVQNDPVNYCDAIGLFLQGVGPPPPGAPPGSDMGVIGEPNVGQLLGGNESGGGGQVPVQPIPPPPLPLPQVPKGSPKDFVKAMNRAFADLEERLRSRPECAALFGGLENALNILAGTEYRYVELPQGQATRLPDGSFSARGAQTIDTHHVQINSFGPFLNQTLLVVTPSGVVSHTFTFEGLSGTSFQSLLLLHELGHQTGVFQSDANNPALNTQQTQQVYDACFK